MLLPFQPITGSPRLREGAGRSLAMLFPNLKSGVGRVYIAYALAHRRTIDMKPQSGSAREC
jgi:hypothetical protein